MPEDRHFVYRLIPPRPTFNLDMSDAEREVMGRHSAYWRGLMAQGRVVVFGPAADDEGAWGLSVFRAPDEDGARAVVEADPAVSSGVATYRLATMLATVLPASA